MQHEAPKAISPASWLAAGLICLIVSSAVLINGASGLFAKSDPALALRINPFRSDERISVAIDRIEEETVRDSIETGLVLSPIDARFFSLMGILAEQDGDLQTASRFYRYSLELLPTEIQALSRQLLIDVTDSQYIDAAQRLEFLGRRWPDKWRAIEPVVPILLSDPASYDRVMQRFGNYPPLRDLLIRSLTRETQLLPYAYRLALDWHNRDAPDLDGIINQVTGSFLREKQYATAYLLFQLTRPDGARAGFVYNGSFDIPFSGNIFDWRIRKQAGVSFDQISRNGDSALSIRFLDNPIQFRNIGQFVRLVPGPYEATVTYEAHNLVMPKPIQVGVRCIPSNAMLAKAPLVDGTSQQADTVDFTVPPTDCGLQEIFFFNDKLPLSWKNRYRGALLIDSVAIMQRRGA